jgi:hypothetical protein
LHFGSFRAGVVAVQLGAEMAKIAELACVSILLSGCALANPTRIDSAGVPVKSEDGFQSVDLPLALDPLGTPSPNDDVKNCIKNGGWNCPKLGAARVGSEPKTAQNREDAEEVVERLRLETAFYAFDHAPGMSQEPDERRNRVLQRLIGASDMNCGIFTQRIYRIQATGNFGLGSLSTLLGGAGAIVTNVDSARLLSGASAAATGLRAELNEDYFRKQWIEALVKAIETRRNKLRTEIAERSGKSIKEYNVQAAVADAIRYNDACSLVSALAEVNQALAIADDPAGLRAFRDAYQRSGLDAKVNISMSSTSSGGIAAADRAPTATASAAMAEIGDRVVGAREVEKIAKSRIEKFEIPTSSDKTENARIAAQVKAETDKAITAIDGEIPKLYDKGAKDYGAKLKPLVDQINKYVDDNQLQGKLLAAATQDVERAEAKERMRTNDILAEITRSAAREAVGEIERNILTITDRLQAQIRSYAPAPA